MDWDEKVYTTISDFIAFEDIAREEVFVKGEVCYRHFTYKDGVPLKETCYVNRKQ
jgi:hypothetical protein